MSRRAIIAGAGIGGLATALALSRAGFDITLYERSEGLEEFGAGLQLTPNANRVLSRLEVLENVMALAMRPSAVCAFRGSDDFTLTRMPVADAERRWGAPYLAIHRADLQRVLAEAVRRRPNVELRFGTTVGDIAIHRDRISIGVMRGLATIQDSADLLIGADGLRSRVRERFGLGETDKPAFAGRVAFRATVDAPRIRFALDATRCLRAPWSQRAPRPLSLAWWIDAQSRRGHRVQLGAAARPMTIRGMALQIGLLSIVRSRGGQRPPTSSSPPLGAGGRGLSIVVRR